jgi:hypothetical protein
MGPSQPELHLPNCYNGHDVYITNTLSNSIVDLESQREKFIWDTYYMKCTEPWGTGYRTHGVGHRAKYHRALGKGYRAQGTGHKAQGTQVMGTED